MSPLRYRFFHDEEKQVPARKVYDLMVKTSEYQNSVGERKGRYIQVGRVMQSDDGSEYILINRTFNPAGVPDLTGKGGDAVLLSKFEPRNNDQGGGVGPTQSQPAAGSTPTPKPQQKSGLDDLNDDIPF
jgi:hypothetical protein